MDSSAVFCIRNMSLGLISYFFEKWQFLLSLMDGMGYNNFSWLKCIKISNISATIHIQCIKKLIIYKIKLD